MCFKTYRAYLLADSLSSLNLLRVHSSRNECITQTLDGQLANGGAYA